MLDRSSVFKESILPVLPFLSSTTSFLSSSQLTQMRIKINVRLSVLFFRCSIFYQILLKEPAQPSWFCQS